MATLRQWNSYGKPPPSDRTKSCGNRPCPSAMLDYQRGEHEKPAHPVIWMLGRLSQGTVWWWYHHLKALALPVTFERVWYNILSYLDYLDNHPMSIHFMIHKLKKWKIRNTFITLYHSGWQTKDSCPNLLHEINVKESWLCLNKERETRKSTGQTSLSRLNWPYSGIPHFTQPRVIAIPRNDK